MRVSLGSLKLSVQNNSFLKERQGRKSINFFWFIMKLKARLICCKFNESNNALQITTFSTNFLSVIFVYERFEKRAS